MKYRTLGRTGVQVSTLALGAMNFGAIGRTDQNDATAIVDAALDAGVNLIDTADMYGRGVLDAIDEIVAPGVDLAPWEKLDTPPSLLDASLRRR